MTSQCTYVEDAAAHSAETLPQVCPSPAGQEDKAPLSTGSTQNCRSILNPRAFKLNICQNSDAISLFPAHALHENPSGFDELSEALAAVSRPTYLTIDVDGLDPSVVPGTGTPEPGGLTWHQAMRIVDAVFAYCDVVGMDVVELAPIEGQQVSEFACAKLLARSLARHYLKT